MKYLVLTPIDVEQKRYQSGEQVELMMFIGDQLVQKGILLPITEETAPIEVEKKVTHRKTTHTTEHKSVIDPVVKEVVNDGNINS